MAKNCTVASRPQVGEIWSEYETMSETQSTAIFIMLIVIVLWVASRLRRQIRLGQTGDGHIRRGAGCEKQNLWEDALLSYQAALACYESEKDAHGQARAHHLMGVLESRRGRHSEALEHWRKSERLIEKTDDQESLALTLLCMGESEEEAGDEGRAADCYRRAAENYHAVGNGSELAYAQDRLENLENLAAEKENSK
jgi:tetratricopeptide (TPR) repeat protein